MVLYMITLVACPYPRMRRVGADQGRAYRTFFFMDKQSAAIVAWSQLGLMTLTFDIKII